MNQQVVVLRPPVRPMTARAALALPDPQRADRFAFEPKFDGFRCLAFRSEGTALLQSRQQRPLTRYFPEIVAGLVDQLPAGTVLDGELVISRANGLDFTALQRRLHPSANRAARHGSTSPATLVVFDVLAVAGRDVRAEPYRQRREIVCQLLDGARAPLALMPSTRELGGAQAWMTEHTGSGIEGVVVKDRQHGYRPGQRTWSKVRTRTTAEAVVAGVIGPLEAPHTLLLGRHDSAGRLRVAGRTSSLTGAARAELGTLLVAPRRAHPWPSTVSSSRFGQLPPEPVVYTPTEPVLVVEVDADLCFEEGRWRHPTNFIRVRSDLVAGDVGLGQF